MASSLMGALATASSLASVASLVATLSLLLLSLLSHPIPRAELSLALTFEAFFGVVQALDPLSLMS